MSAERTFVDTNVFTYLFDDSEPEKQSAARARLEREQKEREIVASTQVLQELYVSLTKGKRPIATSQIAEAAVRAAAAYTIVHVDTALILAGIAASRKHRISFWDALIVCAARAADCDLLLSEDLNDGQVIEKVRIENPFLTRSGKA
jgi:predicted nucleic acid-binding protein